MNIPVPDKNDDGSYSFVAAMTVDADGSPNAYGPGNKGLDYLANAGHPGNWWAIVTDKKGQPVVQGDDDPSPGMYVATTAYERPEFNKKDPNRYLDSEKVHFFVVPSHWRSLIPGIVLGCKAMITDKKTGKSIYGLIGDFGPRSHIGEASIAYAKDFGLVTNPKTGGTEEKRFTYTFWPGTAATGFELQPA
jgi:hypothetical protein